MNKILISLILVLCVISVRAIKQGTCPAPPQIGICLQGCDADEDCSGTKKCVITSE